MDNLDVYLTDQFPLDRQDLAAVDELLVEAMTTLAFTFVAAKGWPYELRPSGYNAPKEMSHSTTAMVLLAIEKALGNWGRNLQRVDLPQYAPAKLPKALAERLSNVAEAAAAALAAAVVDKAGVLASTSGTYGKNDPLTLSYLADLCRLPRMQNTGGGQKLEAAVKQRARELGQITPQEGLDPDNSNGYFLGLKDEKPYRRVVSNAFVPLRILHAVTASKEIPKTTEYREFFETTMHDQLSFSTIPDSRFDPAELTFCLEGILLSGGGDAGFAVDPSIFRRVLEVLGKAQQESAYWRPTKPFLDNERGMVLFPLSVEVANSLLRSCELFDRDKLFDTLGSANLGLFRRYWQWLQARTVRFRSKNDRAVGWHSEHVNRPDAIHVWHTSQIVEFLLNYRRLLQAHIARTTLIRSRFSLRARTRRRTDQRTWEKVKVDFEPVTVLGRHYRVYERMDREFVEGWVTDRPESYSMLLYGPPGTGKTTVAQNLADALAFPLITVTVSDFLGHGGAQIEARAKAIFDVLTAQAECVVLFDEIDNFLLDRDSDRYANQDTVFQFMTPGMLTKINELRQAKRVVFIVATNYENRIDSAIKRVGRIDQSYLVLPPDANARWRMLNEAMRESGQDFGELSVAREQLQTESVFLGYSDINACVRDATRSPAKKVDALLENLRDRARTVTPESYVNRFPSENGRLEDSAPPIEEFLCLVALAAEVESKRYLEGRVFARARQYLSARGGVPEAVRKHVKGISEPLAERVTKAIAAVPGEEQ